LVNHDEVLAKQHGVSPAVRFQPAYLQKVLFRIFADLLSKNGLRGCPVLRLFFLRVIGRVGRMMGHDGTTMKKVREENQGLHHKRIHFLPKKVV